MVGHCYSIMVSDFYYTFLHYTVPSGSPTNFALSVLSSTSVHLSWGLPPSEQRNGIIRQYIVYVELPVGEILSYTTSSSNYTIAGLRPFTTYFFSVAAITIGAGPATERIIAQTSTDGMYLNYLMSI